MKRKITISLICLEFSFRTFTFIQNQPTSSGGGRKPSNSAKQAAAVLGKEGKLGKKDALEKDGASTSAEREGSKREIGMEKQSQFNHGRI